MIRNSYITAILAALLLIAACEPQPADEDEAAAGDPDDTDADEDTFYSSSDTLEMIISWSPGGGTDTIGRFMAPYMAEHIDGEPAIQITNIDGGGGIQGHNEFELGRDADGHTTLFSAGSSKVAYLLDEPGIEFQFEDWEPTVGVPAGAIIYTSPDTGVEEPVDLVESDEELIMGSIGVASTDAIGLLALDILDVNYDTIFGYEGSGDVRTAFEGGEVNLGREGTIGYFANLEPLEDAGDVTPLFSLGQVEDGELVRDPAFPDMPHVAEVYEDIHGEPPEGELWDIYLAMAGLLFNLEKVIWFQEDAPPEAVEALRLAGEEMANDEEFLAAAEEFVGPYELIVGDDLASQVEATFDSLDEATQQGFIEHLEDVHGLVRD